MLTADIVRFQWGRAPWMVDKAMAVRRRRLRGEIAKFGSLEMVAGRAMLKAAQP